MDAEVIVKALIALAPVFILLIVFDRLDAFDLISFREILLLLGLGGVFATLSFLANQRVIEGFPIGFDNYSRYGAPIVEEAMKAVPIIFMFARNRIGFKVDAAIAGFAIGAGFSMIENVWYLFRLSDANVTAWMVRGFGTAVMHGGATALFAIISHEMTERQAETAAAKYRFNPLLFIPGLIVAMAIHAAFNNFPDQPLIVMAMTLLLAPATIFFALIRNERAAQQWLKTDKEVHAQMLADIRAGRFQETALGQTVKAITDRLGDKAADARSFVELKTELVLRAEELIHAAQSGAPATPGADERAKFEQLDNLERRLGNAARTALTSALGFTRNDLWELSRLRARVR
jgi:RsiW-degrading membrane proteinase PrsW (M82 family)